MKHVFTRKLVLATLACIFASTLLWNSAAYAAVKNIPVGIGMDGDLGTTAVDDAATVNAHANIGALEDGPDLNAPDAKFTYAWKISTESRTDPNGTWQDSSGATIAGTGDGTTSTVSTNFGIAAYYRITIKLSVDFEPGSGIDTWHGDNTVYIYQTAVGIEKIQYRVGGQGEYSDITNPIIVEAGGSLDFKAIAIPEGASWPKDKPAWGGTASGTGETTSVTFGAASQTTTDFKTVTAKCGNTVTANALVVQVASLEYRFTQNGEGNGDWTAAPNFPEPLIAPLNATIEFKALRSPAGEEWPPGKPEWSSTGTGITGANGSGESKTVTIDALGNYSVSATCGETKTVNIVVPSLSIESDRDAICGGGWSAAHGYQYLKKDPDGTTHGYVDREKPDPHLATVQVTAKDGDGNTLSGLDVTLTWDMPGDAPAETQTKTTDANGKASFDVISGDQLSKDTDQDTGEVLFDDPVAVKASCLGVKKTKNLEVVAPEVMWQYKNKNGQYVDWDGETSGRYADIAHPDQVLLRCLLTLDNLPVSGHQISWGFDKIFDKAGAEVLSNDPNYSTYGHMSGAISTTATNGGATATYTLGYNYGQIIFRIDDESINTLDLSSSLPDAYNPTTGFKYASFALDSESSSMNGLRFAATQKKKRTKKIGLAHDYYKWVVGPAGFDTSYGYPAPSGEEDQELLPETYNLVVNTLAATTTPYRSNPRDPYSEWTAGIRDPGHFHSPMQWGNWWFSQVIGGDDASALYHYADMKLTKGNYLYLYGAAFDITLTSVPIFEESGRRDEFRTYVFDLRHAGIVAWHRWADEPGSDENEIHCIDPAVPFIKPPLRDEPYNGRKGQILAFLDGETGGQRYVEDWPITQHQKDAVNFRATTQKDDLRNKPAYANASAVNWPDKQ